MREFRFPLSKPKQRLLEAAEQLFSKNGFEAVSVRDITGLAEANVAAINYHFGSREGLIELVVAHRMGPIIKEQMARLEALEKKSTGTKIPPVEEVLEALFRPLATVAGTGSSEEMSISRLLSRILGNQGVIFPSNLEQDSQTLQQRFKRLLSKALPTVAAEELDWRILFINGSVIQLLMGEAPSSSGPTGTAAFGRLIRFAAAGLREGLPADSTAKAGPQATFNF